MATPVRHMSGGTKTLCGHGGYAARIAVTAGYASNVREYRQQVFRSSTATTCDACERILERAALAKVPK